MWTDQVHEERLLHGLEKAVENRRRARHGLWMQTVDATNHGIACWVIVSAACIACSHLAKTPNRLRKFVRRLLGNINASDQAGYSATITRQNRQASTVRSDSRMHTIATDGADYCCAHLLLSNVCMCRAMYA